MIVEAIRLLLTLALTAVGFRVGERLNLPMAGPDASPVIGAVLGAGIGYVAGGVIGRSFRYLLSTVPDKVAPRATGPQLFAGSFGAIVGIVVGIVVSVPLVVLLPRTVGWPLAALIVLVITSFAVRLFAGRAGDFLAATGLRPRGAIERRTITGERRMYVVDSSAAIDGRILPLAKSRLLHGDIGVPGFVIDELQAIADSGDRSRRRRGRRGLDVLEALRDLPGVDVVVVEDTVPEFDDVDAKLVAITERSGAVLVTTDSNLAKAAGIRGLAVVNPHHLGDALQKPAEVGAQMRVIVSKSGTETGQGVGYLDDGTMVVVEGASHLVGEEVDVEVTSHVRTSVGRMIFTRLVA